MTYADNTTTIGRQQRATVVLLGLLAHDLPATTWQLTSISPADYRPELKGQLGAFHEEDGPRVADIAAWARHLGATPQWRQYSGPGGKYWVEAELTGVRVVVWVHLDRCPPECRPPVCVGGGPEPDPQGDAERAGRAAPDPTPESAQPADTLSGGEA